MRLGSRWRRPAPMSMSESVPPTRRVGRAMAWGVAIGVGAVVFRELVRPREQTARLIDWERVETSSLILVEPNVQAWAQKDHLPIDELRRWLAMHEMTHAWEFKAHPWLQGYLEGLLKQVLVGRLGDGQRPSRLELIRTLTVGVGQQWKAISKLQAE